MTKDKTPRVQLNIRVRAHELDMWKEAADHCGLALTSWIRMMVNSGARKEIAGKVRKVELHKV